MNESILGGFSVKFSPDYNPRTERFVPENKNMSRISGFRNLLSLLSLCIITSHFFTSWSASGFLLGNYPPIVEFLRDRRHGTNSRHRCHDQAGRDPFAATHESVTPCNVTRLPPGTRATTLATSFALHWNLGYLRQAVRELKTLYETRVNLTYPGAANVVNLTRLPVEMSEQGGSTDDRPFHLMADDLRRFYVSVNEAEQHEIGLRDYRLNTLEQKLCFVRGHLNNVLCTLHAALEETVQIDIEALTRLVRELAQMRRVHHAGSLDVWVYLLFRDLDNYLQKMEEFVASISAEEK